ncbi:DNA polymerase IV [Rhodopirellula sp. MGV]|uniref:DNA polymerase IV n=1 Tax=Rhodopirellula sp. MGV TaxID=2023130 RepID=UPI000B966EA2|nr:DNA polymerase IV [Rhodopirellula sp. MGV]OYP37726.1 DNA polymerase IV [Rhodopirellula sp. MGV]PNY37164.1 DNA polymerase IV [Rhodopirellula baltica]
MILHIDMDAFYASIEQRDHPEYRGKPVIVGGGNGRGVVSAASYEAREYGVHSAMPGRRAGQLCPHGIFVKGRHSHYAAVGRQVREIFSRYTPLVQPLSLDEAFLDVSGTLRLFGDAETIGRRIKAEIAEELELPASVGVAPRKFIAKIASDIDKPNGFVVVREDEIHSFLDPLPVERVWGVGKVGARRLHQLGFRTIADIRRYDESLLKSKLGAWGAHLWRLANGIDEREVIPDRNAKQISHERTFSEDQSDFEFLHSVVCFLCEQTAMRLRRHGRKAKSVGLKYRREDFRTFSKSKVLETPTDETAVIIRVATELLATMRQTEPRPVRLIGVSLSALVGADAPTQMSLFDDPGYVQAERRVDRVMDQLADRLGDSRIYRAGSHDWRKRPRE